MERFGSTGYRSEKETEAMMNRIKHKPICPACREECAKLHEIVIGGVQRIRVCAACKRAHVAYEKEMQRKEVQPH